MPYETGWYDSATDGTLIFHPQGCPYCSVDSAGKHRRDCPNYKPEVLEVKDA